MIAPGPCHPQDTWPRARGRLDVVLFEGWMLGFRPAESDDAVASVEPNLAAVNGLLRRYVAEWDVFVDAWLVFKIADPGFVYKCVFVLPNDKRKQK